MKTTQMKTTQMKTTQMKTMVAALAMLCLTQLAPASAAPGRATYDGNWHLSFATRSGECDTAYAFDVDIKNGIISHPNLVRLHGTVAPNGAARASVAVQDKFASGSGRLSGTSGSGVWSGHSGTSKCAGYWTAQKN